jgi:oligoendopeptidase F
MTAQQVPTRSEANATDTWDLTLMYADDAAWERELGAVDTLIATLVAHQGHVGTSADSVVATIKGSRSLDENSPSALYLCPLSLRLRFG